MKILECFSLRNGDYLFKVKTSGNNNINNNIKQFLPLPVYHYVCSQSVCQGNAQSRMPCRRNCRPILQHTLVFYFPLESGTNPWMHVRGIYCEALDSWLGIHCRNAGKWQQLSLNIYNNLSMKCFLQVYVGLYLSSTRKTDWV